MSQVSVLQRRQSVRLLEPGRPADVVEVFFLTETLGPRSVTLPLASYRPALPEELADNPRYQMRPVDQAALDAERKAIQEEIERVVRTPPETFELP